MGRGKICEDYGGKSALVRARAPFQFRISRGNSDFELFTGAWIPVPLEFLNFPVGDLGLQATIRPRQAAEDG